MTSRTSESRAAAILLGVAAAACGPVLESAPPPAVSRQAVVGGAPEPGLPFVAAIVPVSPFCGEADAAAPVICTGTLVSPRVLLTAAHCVENADAPQVYAVVFAEETAHASAAQRVRVAEGRLHPAWRPGVNDIGVLLLAGDAPVTPLALEPWALSSDSVGRLARVVGFGSDAQGVTGLRRGGLSRITSVDANTFAIEAAPAMSCGGDSGGPVFVAHDGVEHLAGITSFGDLACTTGANTRVDLHAAFIQSAIEDAARQPPARAPMELRGDACARRCATHADCALGMACVPQADGVRSCAVAGLEAGRFGAVCTGEQDGHPCVKAAGTCRLWLPCAEAPPASGGCAVGDGRPGLLAGLLVSLTLLRRRTPAVARRE
ncbi:trypsin-like serine protease [Comamonas sp. JC664]|uniref:S1 family peptidase n=1 Tax=Comamonas sp. JC664 TaxID=2801917 RepID=UPI00191D2B5D|nr:trypsin-like serine protease [Comamonas sp. JC664]GHH04048.1 hypothetical protein GCM10012319_73250 [Comamonas sp. KCTC 72670]